MGGGARLPCYNEGPVYYKTRMWANAQPDGRPAVHRRPLFNAAKFGGRPLLDTVQQRCQDAEAVESSWGARNSRNDLSR